MDYEKKYKEAFEIAKGVYHDHRKDRYWRDWLTKLFPELKESEDEQMIERLKSCVYASDLTTGGRNELIAWLEKQGEKKPTENVEIKFCEGDKVVSNQDGKVYTVGTTYYVTGDNICLHGTDGNHKWTNEDDLNRNYHLWTIQDANDGDVLVCEGREANILPATKEQRDLLFAKMKEAGYEWDAEKKELKEIGPKTLYADKVIAWLAANICDFEYYIKLFKKDFGL